MTDNEIIKTLQEMADYPHNYEEGQDLQNALDLINRQQAENERLKNILICFMGALGKVRNIDDIESISQIPIMTELNKGIRAEIKAEAYKEFAEKAKEFMHNKFKALDEYEFEYITERDIDNLSKETVGEDNA